MKQNIKFKLNHKSISITVDDERMLLWILRIDLGLTGAKYGCGEGFCAACTVLVNNRAVRSCQFPMREVHGKEVITIEGLAQNGKLHPIQEAFIEEGATQCGYCTPGFVMRTKVFLEENPKPTDDEIRQGLVGNICRCTGYKAILAAVRKAARKMKA